MLLQNCMQTKQQYNIDMDLDLQATLAEVGVTGHVGQAGYYFMPDFEVLRPALAARYCTLASAYTSRAINLSRQSLVLAFS